MSCRLLLIYLVGLCSFSQTPAPHTKILTPQQKQFQADLASWNERIKDIHIQGQGALDAEMKREDVPLCPNADNTRSQEICEQSEMAKTQTNYDVFAGAIRAILALPAPVFPGIEPRASGPTGTPLSSAQFVMEFDRNEEEWKKCKADLARAAFDQYKGGTLALVFAGEADLRLMRLHMRELAFIYGWKVSIAE